MRRHMQVLVQVAGGWLLAANVALILLAKVVLPVGGIGLADIIVAPAPMTSQALVVATNDTRRSAGIGPLTVNTALGVAAQARLDDMARLGYFAHQSLTGRMPWDFIKAAGYAYQGAGENLARGFADAQVVVDAWLNSPAHRANLLNASYRDVGIAIGPVTVDGTSGVVVVELYASPHVASAPVPQKLPPATANQRVSTDRTVPLVTGASRVSPATATIASNLAGYLTAWLGALVGALTLAALWVKDRRRLTIAWVGHATLLAVLVLVPTLSVGSGLIY